MLGISTQSYFQEGKIAVIVVVVKLKGNFIHKRVCFIPLRNPSLKLDFNPEIFFYYYFYSQFHPLPLPLPPPPALKVIKIKENVREELPRENEKRERWTILRSTTTELEFFKK